MKIYCPIPKKYLNLGSICILTQLYGENKNALFYGPEGHTGLDFRTQVQDVWESVDWEWTETGDDLVRYHWGKNAKVRRVPAERFETQGRIQLLAAHDGVVTTVLHADKERSGWGIYITAEPDGDRQYRSLYWHIETPWSSLGKFWGTIQGIIELVKNFTGRQVKTGQIVAIGGNNGLSTGPHLHYELQMRKKRNDGSWGSWERLNPIEYFADHDVLYQDYNMTSSRYFYRGKELTQSEAKKVMSYLPKLTK